MKTETTNEQPDSAGIGLYPKYFVLKPRGDSIYAAASRRAMREYARTIKEENAKLAKDVLEWADHEWMETPTAKSAAQALVDADGRR